MATIGHFRIVQEIGRGGAGVVYLAEDTEIPGRLVALKRLRPEVAAADAEVLRREATTLAAIEHPHILTVHEVGTAEDGLYLVTEYMPAGSLADRLDSGRMSVTEALTAAHQAASALAAAHERGILHRDVKPANLLVAQDGRVKVSDFGLAVNAVPKAEKDVETTATVTLDVGAGSLYGTPLYIPPEALAGLPATPAADQFAFGVAFHEMLSGRRPFSRRRGLRAVLDPPAIDRKIPSDLVRIVVKCLAKDPRQRFADMKEVVAALDRAITRRGRDRRRLIAVVTIVAVVGALSLTAWRVRVWRSRQEATRLNEYGRTALEKGEFAEARRLFLAARGADPKYLTACTNLGALALLDKDPSWAIAILGDCAASFGNVDIVVYNHASALRRAGNLAGAEAALSRAVVLARGRPLEAPAASELILVLIAEGRAGDAVALGAAYRPATADTMEKAILLKSIGLAELADGSTEAAAKSLRAAIAGPLPKGPRIEALLGLGRAEEADGNKDAAVAAFAEAIASGAEGKAKDEATEGLSRNSR